MGSVHILRPTRDHVERVQRLMASIDPDVDLVYVSVVPVSWKYFVAVRRKKECDVRPKYRTIFSLPDHQAALDVLKLPNVADFTQHFKMRLEQDVSDIG